ncbi:type II and III secretion system protein family protein [Plastoroseomonas hellenica]|uniref:type II and III secretion system protein family protein n=1 Tax=Plastoroseomonas hellenica TaxID=2687306 RepID=UPI001BA9E822|nr:pilus assembly protein N-terminal domain-containing protein [Plastoroseomonas hellenica]MBR0646328.1 pilus assembly protein CpaC [Plastoroseomonas hellenica]
MRVIMTLLLAALLGLPADAHAQAGAIGLGVGAQQVLDVGADVTRVAVGDPTVADIGMVGDRQLRIVGTGPGATDVVIWRGERQQRIRVSVAGDPAGARALTAGDPALRGTRVGAEGGRVVVRGDVPSLEAQQRLLEAARARQGDMVDLTRIRGDQVVAVEVKFAAVSSRRLRAIGFDFSALGGSLQVSSISPSSPTAGLAGAGALSGVTAPIATAFNLLVGQRAPNQIQTALSLLTSTDFAQVLAEPVLLVRSGERASFLAGGEVPIPVPQGGLSNTITIEYRPFGVRLEVSPVVLSPERILLRVAPEVSELDFSNALSIQGYTVPAFRKRSTSTTVELGSGQSFMLAGLTSVTNGNLEQRIPGIGQLPIIGALFSRVQAQRDAQELVIIATPRLVRPMSQPQAEQALRPLRQQAPLPSVGDIILQRNTAAEASARFGLLP